MAQISVNITGLDSLLERLDGIQDRAANAAPFLRSVPGHRIDQQLRQVFKEEGPGWKELSEYTKRVRRFKGLPILVQTGRGMRDVIDFPPEEVYIDTYVRGIDNSYMLDHERGRPDREPPLPKRAFLIPAFHRALKQIRREYRDWLMTGKLPLPI